MLGKIKSTFITKVVLFFLKDIKRLKLIKYNKYFQNKMNIDILHYKIYSGKYIIYKSKNKGKEYDAYNNKLIFRGEYLNGERNGKGREYNEEGKVIFEGEYLKGKRNGIGKEYNKEGNLIFLEVISKKKRYIKDAENSREINLLFKGQYLKWVKNGEGEKFFKNGKTEFIGEYLNGKNGTEKHIIIKVIMHLY